ncbi:MAG: hypothetical protein GWP08_18635 [Nitrospiraceae bacterium]|nr:hypothetical protein [Nitrospiraceae bacterium]
MFKTLLILLLLSVGVLLAAGGSSSEVGHAEYRLVIGSLAAVIVAQYWQAARDRAEHSRSEGEVARMCGELSLLLQQIPDDLRHHRESVNAILREFRDCMNGCSLAQADLKRIANHYREE